METVPVEKWPCEIGGGGGGGIEKRGGAISFARVELCNYDTVAAFHAEIIFL